MLIIHCSFTRKSLLVSTWFLSPWLGETANNYFRLFGENILSEKTEKVGSQWALQSSVRLSTLLLLKSILATERSRISRYLSHHQGFHSPASSMLTHHPTSYQPHYTPPLCLSHIIITRNMDGVLPCNDSRCTVHCTI